jgi:mRNA interferase RelE/StbE
MANIRIAPQAKGQDMPLLQNLHIRITGAIASRLTRTPHQYSTPLRKALRGYWKLRVEDYRLVYKIERKEVWVLGIQHRKTVYEYIVQKLG